MKELTAVIGVVLFVGAVACVVGLHYTKLHEQTEQMKLCVSAGGDWRHNFLHPGYNCKMRRHHARLVHAQ